MDDSDFTTIASGEASAYQAACLKTLLTLILKTISQLDIGKVIIKIEKYATKTKYST
ncbi:DUF2594 family protein [Pectobacteriaceae bacterium CE90]|nr:DUF2594 family protein [Prodigiosinella sp. LS101]WJV55350.1 DUF2594 family protein [Prodigiosinella sp. LS101]WJV59712.1 DUF2594 family protein [Pectobacteriaceae bacterium C111]WJY13652.1 DUF2594 family protein [Pectobacteriaceae bacterium CE90]